MDNGNRRKRAISLAGGGPAAGLHIGVLLRLDEVNKERKARGEEPIEFQVWALSCIGAWVGIVYNQFEEDAASTKAEKTYEFFKDRVFRDDAGYERFPINRAFGPDTESFVKAWMKFVGSAESYHHLVLPHEHFIEATRRWFQFLMDPGGWTRHGDVNAFLLNDVLAVNPAVRFLVSLMYLSEVNGLTRIYYKDSSFLESIDFPMLKKASAPEIYHNAWNLVTQSMQLFSNKRKDKYQEITPESLCACSALPYIEQTVGEYCEGALVDTVNFKDLLEDYDEPERLDEVWVSRIVDASQVKVPNNIHDGLSNLCMLFAAELGENDVKLFKQHLHKRRRWKPRVIEIPLSSVPQAKDPRTAISFRWNHDNLDRGVTIGRAALNKVLEHYH